MNDNFVSPLSTLSPDDANKLVGATILHVDAHEFGLTLKLSSGVSLQVNGSGYGGVDDPLDATLVRATQEAL